MVIHECGCMGGAAASIHGTRSARRPSRRPHHRGAAVRSSGGHGAPVYSGHGGAILAQRGSAHSLSTTSKASAGVIAP
jgi:hypothetical protein